MGSNLPRAQFCRRITVLGGLIPAIQLDLCQALCLTQDLVLWKAISLPQVYLALALAITLDLIQALALILLCALNQALALTMALAQRKALALTLDLSQALALTQVLAQPRH